MPKKVCCHCDSIGNELTICNACYTELKQISVSRPLQSKVPLSDDDTRKILDALRDGTFKCACCKEPVGKLNYMVGDLFLCQKCLEEEIMPDLTKIINAFKVKWRLEKSK